ncbi:MAG TPA: HAMP domain-containing sensor histidine kinase [Thermoleophilaceae bacterium]|nr:HAMP domain-containing sensor histidine kinase [Thermoleophilaceae bacterium]
MTARARLRRRLPVQIRLAVVSASLTFAILGLFAVVVGVFGERQVRSEFDDELKATTADLQSKLITPGLNGPLVISDRKAVDAATVGRGVIWIFLQGETPVTSSALAPSLGPPKVGVHDYGEYRVVARTIPGNSGQVEGHLQYAKPRAGVNRTVARIRLFLALGVVGGTVLAFFAGLALARRAMRPVVNLTKAAGEIARTRDPTISLPKPEVEDEVADLANTLEEMLHALDDARAETEGALARQREFVADASHELRTPLTSILANLELLEAELTGDDRRDMASSALRSSRRMRRLVADLLLLARADAGRAGLHEVLDLTEVVSEAVGEAAPVAAGHSVSVDLPDGEGRGPFVSGVRDDLHRLVLNLVENALAHTPPGTEVNVRLSGETGQSVLSVSDAGPGIPPELRERIFDRFVRGDAESAGGGSGLGLAIVRAVAQRHGGSVEVTASAAGGAEFLVRLPLAQPPAVTPLQPPAAPSAGA